MNKFVDRTEELDFLNKEYERNGSSLVVLYGRRRIGKNSFNKRVWKEQKYDIFLATEETELQNIESFKKLIALNFKNELLEKSRIDNWETLFGFIVNAESETKRIIVIDEFQYLGKINSAFPSKFQKIWDELLKDENIMVILCGSLINMMESQTLNYNSPLYGRRTGQIKLKQIAFKHYEEFFEDKLTEKELIDRYAITGGVPKYIENFTEKVNIFDSIKQNIINKQSYLYEEPYFLLQNEVTEIGNYFSIIKSIAGGNRKLGNIATNLSVSPTNLSKYLQTLVNLDILEREVPVTEANQEKSKKGQYKIRDNFINFWFQFIYPNRSFIEIGQEEFVLNKIKANFVDNNVSYVYEDICRERMWDLNKNSKLGIKLDKIGRWWNKSEEIDIVGIDTEGEDIVFGECKYYTNKLMDVDVFYNLLKKSKCVEWKNDKRNEKFVLFSINGYTKKLKELAQSRKDLILA